ncbi:hypothetical protein EK0264_07590 [Epidermidibacterium keratini]|uniref:DUF4352 domain-containing protein n=1 Tax=Epidermidibacterium keratini TaxID=1891644 RepID=A0A7L4YMV5_9ACTN|nr:hypothetical protein [Epidermidibacterium keratini]QHC00149.1 hypothetical protein EK0264_07590 [Epidermidibacterium keratini]
MTDSADARRPRWLWWLIALLAAIAVIAALVVQNRSADDPPSGSSSASTSQSSATASSTPTIPPSDIAIDPSASRPVETPTPQPPASGAPGPELAPVAPDAEVVTPSGIVISLGKLETLSSDAVAPGEIAGPAIRATVVIDNASTAPLDLEYVVVNAYYGADRTPAGTAMTPGGAPFEGAVEAGASAQGVYLFTIPEQERSDVTITVDYKSGEASAVFQGDLA